MVRIQVFLQSGIVRPNGVLGDGNIVVNGQGIGLCVPFILMISVVAILDGEGEDCMPVFLPGGNAEVLCCFICMFLALAVPPTDIIRFSVVTVIEHHIGGVLN